MSVSRRDLIKSSVLGSAIYAGASTSQFSSAQSVSGNLFTVGSSPDADFANLQDALAAISNTSKSNPFTILLLPGLHDLEEGGRGPIICKPYVSIIGLDRNSCIVKAGKWINIKLNHFTSLSNFTLKYLGDDPNRGAIEMHEGSLMLRQDSSEVKIDNVRIEASGSAIALKLARVYRAVIKSCEIVTESTGIHASSYSAIEVTDTNIWLKQRTDGTQSVEYIAVYDEAAYGRLWWWGGKVTTGYPYTQINDGSADIIGFYRVNPDSSGTYRGGRLELFNVWSILRNDAGASQGVRTQNVRTEGSWVRIHGGYYQAEDNESLAQGEIAEFASIDTSDQTKGKIEVFADARYKRRIGNTYQVGPSSGTENVTSDVAWGPGDGGIKLCDSTDNPLLLRLPAVPTIGEEYIIKRMDNSTNVITVEARAGIIEGNAAKTLNLEQYSTLHIKSCGPIDGNSGSIFWYIVNEK